MRTLSNIEALLHPNKISDKLAEQYRKDSDSLARHHQQLVDQGQQWLDAKAKASPVKMLDKFASTFNTVATAVKPSESGKAKAAKETYQEIDTWAGKYNPGEEKNLKPGEKLESFEDALHKIVKFKENSNKSSEDYIEFNKILDRFDATQREQIKNLHGDRLITTKSFLAGHTSATVPAKWNAMVNYQGDDPELIKDRDLARSYADKPVALKAFKRRWASKQFGDELLDKGMMFTHASKNIKTWIDSDGVRGKVGATQHILTQKTVDFGNSIGVTLSNDDASVVGGLVKKEINVLAANIGEEKSQIQWSQSGGTFDGEYIEGITPESSNQEIARKIVKNRLEQLAADGYLSSAELDHINTRGAIETGVGDSVEKLYKDDEWAQLRASARKGDIIRTDVALAKRDASFAQTRDSLLAEMSDPNNWNKDKLQNAINTLEAKGADEKYIRPLSQMLNSTQSQTELQKLKQDWAKKIEEGLNSENIDKEIEAIPHGGFKAKMKQLRKDLNFERNELNFDEGLEATLGTKINYDGKTLLNKKGEFQGQAVRIKTKLTKLGNKLLAKGYAQGLRGNDLQVFVDRGIDREWTTNGGGVRDGDGIYSITVHGKFENYKKHTDKLADIKRDAQETATEHNTGEWENQLQSAKRGLGEGGTWGDLNDDPEAIMDATDFAGMTATGIYSEELKWKAARLNLAPGTLYEMQLQALIASPDPKHQDLVARYNLGEVEVNEAEVKFFKALELTPEISKMVKQRRIEYLSPNQLQRVNAAIETAGLTQQRQKAAGDLAKQSRKSLEEGESMTGVQSIQEENAERIEKGKEDMANKLRSMTHPDGTQLYEEEAIQDLLDSGMAFDELEKFYNK